MTLYDVRSQEHAWLLSFPSVEKPSMFLASDVIKRHFGAHTESQESSSLPVTKKELGLCLAKRRLKLKKDSKKRKVEDMHLHGTCITISSKPLVLNWWSMVTFQVVHWMSAELLINWNFNYAGCVCLIYPYQNSNSPRHCFFIGLVVRGPK